MTIALVEEAVLDVKERFYEFIRTYRDRSGQYKYMNRIRQMITMGQKSLVVDYNDLYVFDTKLARLLIDHPDVVLRQAAEAVQDIVTSEAPEYAEGIERFRVRIRALPKTTPLRGLRSEYIGRLVMLEGILVRTTPVREKIVKAVFQHCTKESCHEFEWPPEGEIVGEELEKPPTCPVCGSSSGTFRLIPEKSKLIDWQRIVLQERPEEVPPGQLPRSIEVVLQDELVDSARPGDRVTVVGIVRIKPDTSTRKKKAIYDLYIEANHIEVSQKVLEEVKITREDEERIKALARDPWIHKRIVASIAPAIYGHWDIKEAIALALFGGVPKLFRDGVRIRGDIHVLIVGDPGTAKSQLLLYASKIAPRGIYTSGKGATAAGLTAAVIRDKTTGEYYLEAGALVLADGGVAAIDEIDKMRDEDRSAIHEAMEQQTVSIAKAGIVAKLNARTTVIAAGNPKFGRYLPNRTLADNINLPPTILSRFDLIFILRDTPNPEEDRKLARHVLQAHRETELIKPEIEPELLRKYISYARRYVRPRLTPEAAKLIEDFFVEMRRMSSENPEGPISITTRQLEALIRLAEAHARIALRNEVTVEDAEAAIRLMKAFLESAGLDVESGRIDIDVIMTGKPRSKQEKLTRILEIIEQLESESDEGCARLREIQRRAAAEGIESSLVEEAISSFRRDGIIYEKTIGCYAVVR
ncbi:minichromosome maintenance protein MCM [Hyperthermus butylicus]|uniref:DNA helicase n=1 Tax=Hyperthermus butylicus (strain DSM 5456 / JCM 9403 / PLM1-5) TaxID=415426 RepID=A2BL91_HYPBU|nr:minichromosome maintenance protein MCM [Hyperthermus butylicus]ABM80752.1 minichromosome maintenance complex [Hyperthermus butylicus DSM 5456]